ncbi:hypothetical protein CONLIGDRAFT_521353 [Coniochaeta ligniaria NRRL 30616]|uniref:Uncharacterized protein n=1 Tax=Coniochaeta ligniaria NRRL 30616 TaxID=1408157 RepID=A0A1J7IFG1_9PEZI|nr:hypothetical protein CONLIGDRAFT_521353 [Coniochaeta ligniaria NRRL 30616]
MVTSSPFNINDTLSPPSHTFPTYHFTSYWPSHLVFAQRKAILKKKNEANTDTSPTSNQGSKPLGPIAAIPRQTPRIVWIPHTTTLTCAPVWGFFSDSFHDGSVGGGGGVGFLISGLGPSWQTTWVAAHRKAVCYLISLVYSREFLRRHGALELERVIHCSALR